MNKVKTHKNTVGLECYWAIGLLFQDGIKFVTKIENYPKKIFEWEDDKEPLYFENKKL